MNLPENPSNILIIKPSSLGDVVSAIPVLRSLKRKFPTAKFTWLIAKSCLDIIDADPDLDEIIIFDRKKIGKAWFSFSAAKELFSLKHKLASRNFDLVIDIQGLLRSAMFAKWTKSPIKIGFSNAREGAPLFYNIKHKTTEIHTVDRNCEIAKLLGAEILPTDMKLAVHPDADKFAHDILSKNAIDPRKYIVCVPPTRWATKLYPTRHWRKVVEALSQKMPIILLGSPAKFEVDLCKSVADGQPNRVLTLAGKTSLKQLVAIISNAAGVICSDSAAQFIAPATKTPCLSLIGPTSLERTGPFWGLGEAVVADVPCQGCLKKRCDHISCMQSIQPSEVIARASKLFNLE